ncbi:hypothetical protein OSB04_012830 [Centaurea solstitialis]|uniref:Retrotransposon gag domain-containing protein n=1 Tax=Centaurea solstitialis TaxID=347529 RepID=A0AA38WQW6_9ASTR|nr:hypothetical protein OSB04_012830 [Centaurea solstitialis]
MDDSTRLGNVEPHLRYFMAITNAFLIPRFFHFLQGIEEGHGSILCSLAQKHHGMIWVKYFPPNRNVMSWSEIFTFKQFDDETIHDVWEKFKELLRRCPHHDIPYCIQLETFYYGLNLMQNKCLMQHQEWLLMRDTTS